MRIKILAFHLGPTFFGIVSLYTTWLTLVGGITSLGLGSSAVREVAAASGSGDADTLSRTITALRRITWITGTIGVLVGLAFAYPASFWTFGNGDHTVAIACLSITLLLTQLQAGHTALVQGTRRIGDLARIAIFGAIWSTVIAIPLLLALGNSGIVPFLLAAAAGQLFASWWYARRVKCDAVSMDWRETWQRVRTMLTLGIVFVIAGVATVASTYAIRLIIQHQLGVVAVGLYSSAFNIAGVYVGFVLQAMAGDYYPRLSALTGDAGERNKLVNEQAEMAMLLALPGLVAALVFSDLLIWALYSPEFSAAGDILRLQMVGMLGRIVSFPLGVIVLARADHAGYLFIELLSALVHVGGVWVGIGLMGLSGAGAAFAFLYGLNALLIFALATIRHDFVFRRRTALLLGAGTVGVGAAFLATQIADDGLRLAVGLALFALSTAAAFHGLAQRAGYGKIALKLHGLCSRLSWGRR